MRRQYLPHGDLLSRSQTSSLGIVIPTLNAEKTLRQTLESVRGLRADGADVIVVDGGSSDGTRVIAEGFGAKVIEWPGGMYAAINAGCRLLDTAWLTWINADDVLYGDAIGRRLASCGDADVVYGRVDFIDCEGRFLHSWLSAAPRHLRCLFSTGYSPILQQGTLFRRDVFVGVGGFQEAYKLVGDADFWYRALEQGFSFHRDVSLPAAAFRLHSRQLSRLNRTESLLEHQQMIASHRPARERVRGLLAMLLWRISNWRGYLVRALRHYDLGGRRMLPQSYELAHEHAEDRE
jgi:glycosyltransferase involved in cell wall biosynthesis